MNLWVGNRMTDERRGLGNLDALDIEMERLGFGS